jgi:hypothetical protein
VNASPAFRRHREFGDEPLAVGLQRTRKLPDQPSRVGLVKTIQKKVGDNGVVATCGPLDIACVFATEGYAIGIACAPLRERDHFRAELNYIEMRGWRDLQ